MAIGPREVVAVAVTGHAVLAVDPELGGLARVEVASPLVSRVVG